MEERLGVYDILVQPYVYVYPVLYVPRSKECPVGQCRSGMTGTKEDRSTQERRDATHGVRSDASMSRRDLSSDHFPPSLVLNTCKSHSGGNLREESNQP